MSAVIALPLRAASASAHLVDLGRGEWACWRTVMLRSAGFPLDGVRRLAAPRCLAAADSVLDAEAELQEWQSAAEQVIHERVRGETDATARLALVRAARDVARGRRPSVEAADVQAAVERLQHARECAATARTAWIASFADAERDLVPTVRDVAASPHFREALLWQNRAAYHTAVGPLLAGEASAAKRERQRVELVVRYLQRYCAKNETVGFFGPLGWGTWSDGSEALAASPGRSLVAARRVFFEAWGIDVLAAALDRQYQLGHWIAPRLVPLVRLDGLTLTHPSGHRLELTPTEAAVVRLCDGHRLPSGIAATVGAARDRVSVGDVLALLQRLGASGWVRWTAEVPIETYPEDTLRRLLDRIDDVSRRDATLGALQQLEAGKRRVAEAAGNPDALDAALDRLECEFTALTGHSPTRGAGRAYAARTLVYEDCTRDIELRLGSALNAALAPGLTLVLTSARWFTHVVAEEYRACFSRVHAQMVADTGTVAPAAALFWQRIQPLFFGAEAPVAGITRELQRRWWEILQLDRAERRVHRGSADLSPLVDRRFDAPAAGWQTACSHSPDILIGGNSVAGICAGDFELVLGDFHPALNLLLCSTAAALHPSPADLAAGCDADWPRPRVVMALAKHAPRETARTHLAVATAKDLRIECTPDPSAPLDVHSRPIADFVVEQTGAGLVVRSLDGEWSVDVVEFFADALSRLTAAHFHMFAALPHVPRVTIDRVVIGRETWRVPATGVVCAWLSGAEQFLEARRWARSLDLPQYVFVRSPLEVKPVYVDLASPALVQLLSRLARAAAEADASAEMQISEMLPGPDRMWLSDADGRRYTSELRMVAVDLLSRARQAGTALPV